MRASCQYVKNSRKLGKRKNLDELLFYVTETAERRLWLAVIFDAILKLDSQEEFLLVDENDNKILDSEGRSIKKTEAEEAQEFLSGKTGALWTICKMLDINANVIVKDFKKYGPLEIKNKMLAYLSGE
jgi:hypothetical protein